MENIKVFVNREPVSGPFGGGNNFLSAFCGLAKDYKIDVTFSLDPDIDGVLIADNVLSRLAEQAPALVALKQSRPNVQIVHRVNEGDARKGTSNVDETLRAFNPITDATVFVSYWQEDYHVTKGWSTPYTTVIYNGVNLDSPKAPNAKRSGPISIVTHHWSNNRMKGFDIYEAIDRWLPAHPDFAFSYVGRELGTFKNTRIVPPLAGKELAEELSRHDVYVTGSLFDPGPNHVLEALAVGLPCFAITRGGGAVEFAGKSHSFADFSELEAILLKKEFLPNDSSTKLQSWSDCVAQYCDLFRLLLVQQRN